MKGEPAFRNIPILLAAPADIFDEQDARNAGADAILRKPFEALALLDAVQTLDRATIRAAVTLALDSAMPALIEKLTERVVLALSYRG